MSGPPSQTSFVAPSISQLVPLFPGYEIESLIATGGMGAVYCAIQKSLDRTVAIKILPREFGDDEAFCRGFETEAKAMARLNHPNLIGVYDFGEVEGMLFIIMEYVPGESLFHAANGAAIDPSEVIRIVSGVCNGLAHAHENGILHRDIKPSNILLDLNSEPKIGDFGLARPVDRKVEAGEEIFGTPHYTAPEVVRTPHAVDQRADIFSVGVLLHELLTGKLPADDPRPASTISHSDPRFDAIVRRAANPLPAARYASAAEITRELQAIGASAGPRVLRTAAAAGGPGRPAVGAPASRRPAYVPVKKSSGAPAIWLLVAVIAAILVLYALLSQQDPVKPAAGPPEIGIPHGPRPLPPPSPESLGPVAPPPEIVRTPPQPEPQPEPEPEVVEVSVDKPPVEPEAVKPAVPKFDVPAFYARARSIMKERAAPLIGKRDKAFADNLASFQREGRRLIRRIDTRWVREAAETRFDNYIRSCEAGGKRLSSSLGDGLELLPDLVAAHRQHLDSQRQADALLLAEINQLSATYILGLEKQIERLVADDDPAAVNAIREEITAVRAKPTYFAELMLGELPPAAGPANGERFAADDD